MQMAIATRSLLTRGVRRLTVRMTRHIQKRTKLVPASMEYGRIEEGEWRCQERGEHVDRDGREEERTNHRRMSRAK